MSFPYHNQFIECMLENTNFQNEPELGPFWYDTDNQECFGVKSVPAIDCPWYESTQFNQKVRTGRALHSTIWKKEHFKNKDFRFKGDYKYTPRGRVFQFSNNDFVVCTGKWINKCPEAKNIIIQEFQLPNTTQFVIDSHWDIGHGFSQEF